MSIESFQHMSQLAWCSAVALLCAAAMACASAPDTSHPGGSGSMTGMVGAGGAPFDTTRGTSGTGGSGGMAGAGSAPVVCPGAMSDDLISDFKLDNSIFASTDGRQGGWYVYGDKSGTYDPPVVSNTAFAIDTANGNADCSGAGSLRLKGTGFKEWGAALGTDFRPRADVAAGMTAEGRGYKQTYDASKYRGVAFWAKSSMPLKNVSVKFPDFFQDNEAQSEMVGCVLASGTRYNCSPYLVMLGSTNAAFMKYADRKIDMTWKRFEVFFEDAKQDTGNPGWVMPPGDKLNKDKLVGLAIQINADYSSGSPMANDFEIWIDDVEFIK